VRRLFTILPVHNVKMPILSHLDTV